MNRLDDAGAYPIREFARLTGVNPVTLRAWERRYGIIRPERTAKGHRFYTDDHITQVKHILYWLDQGYPIRQVRMLLKDGAEIPTDGQARQQEWQECQTLLLAAARRLNAQHLEELWNNGFATYPLAVYFDYCLRPVLEKLRGDQHSALHAHCFEYLLKRKLAALLMQHQRQIGGPAVLAACQHPQAELETLASACALSAAEIRVEYFGSGLSVADLTEATQQLDISHLWLHLSPLAENLNSEWQALPARVQKPVCLSGASHFPLSDHNNIRVMPVPLAQQIRSFITGLAEERV